MDHGGSTSRCLEALMGCVDNDTRLKPKIACRRIHRKLGSSTSHFDLKL